MTLGQEFNAFAHTILEDVDRLGEAQALIREINMGATAIGTGINASPGYAESVRRHLEYITGLPLTTAPDLVEATAEPAAMAELDRMLQLADEVVRHKIIRLPEKVAGRARRPVAVPDAAAADSAPGENGA